MWFAIEKYIKHIFVMKLILNKTAGNHGISIIFPLLSYIYSQLGPIRTLKGSDEKNAWITRIPDRPE